MIAADLEATHQCAARWARVLAAQLGPDDTAVLGLIGELGAGKTAFVQGFMAALDPKILVTSPTYALVQVYPTLPQVRHCDLYRLGSVDDLDALGGRELFTEPGIVLVEWADRVSDVLPPDWIEIRLAVTAADVREISFRAHGVASRLLDLVQP